jgi:hypothetical protein
VKTLTTTSAFGFWLVAKLLNLLGIPVLPLRQPRQKCVEDLLLKRSHLPLTQIVQIMNRYDRWKPTSIFLRASAHAPANRPTVPLGVCRRR